jgi:hypothetical protein
MYCMHQGSDFARLVLTRVLRCLSRLRAALLHHHHHQPCFQRCMVGSTLQSEAENMLATEMPRTSCTTVLADRPALQVGLRCREQ